MRLYKFAPLLSVLFIISVLSCTSEPEKADPVEPVNEDTVVVEETIEVVVEETKVEEEVFEVTKEVYDKTFDEINALITHLDGIIAKKDYTLWMEYLSQPYIATYSDKAVLKEKSESPILQMNDIVLRDIKDYFYNVVVPSRMSLHLEEIEFDDENHVTAWTIFNDNKTKLYQLELIDGDWKISIW